MDSAQTRQTLVGVAVRRPSDRDLAGVTLAGRYDVLELLGAGGMGAVYRAHDRELDEMVALKVIRSVMTVVGGAIALIGRGIAQSFEQQALLVTELQTRGIRKRGTVVDAVPCASPHGGAVVQPEGADGPPDRAGQGPNR